jgi:hypothetical protein
MVKEHTRKKRLMGLSSGKRHRYYFEVAHKKKGDRTFATKEQAEAYAKEKGIKKYTIAPAKKNKRFKIVLA